MASTGILALWSGGIQRATFLDVAGVLGSNSGGCAEESGNNPQVTGQRWLYDTLNSARETYIPALTAADEIAADAARTTLRWAGNLIVEDGFMVEEGAVGTDTETQKAVAFARVRFGGIFREVRIVGVMNHTTDGARYTGAAAVDVGVDGSGNATLTDSRQAWTTNQWADRWVICAGVKFEVASNTSTVLTGKTPWISGTPDGDQAYSIQSNGYPKNRFKLYDSAGTLLGTGSLRTPSRANTTVTHVMELEWVASTTAGSNVCKLYVNGVIDSGIDGTTGKGVGGTTVDPATAKPSISVGCMLVGSKGTFGAHGGVYYDGVLYDNLATGRWASFPQYSSAPAAYGPGSGRFIVTYAQPRIGQTPKYDQWAKSAGSDAAALLDEIREVDVGGSDRISTTTVNEKQSWFCETSDNWDVPAFSHDTFYAAQSMSAMYGASDGSAAIRIFHGINGGADDTGRTIAMTSTKPALLHCVTLDPAGAALTKATLEAMETGVEATVGAGVNSRVMAAGRYILFEQQIARALAPAVMTLTAVTPARTAVVSVALAPSVMTLSAVTPSISSGGGAQNVALTPGLITLSAVTPARTAAVAVALTPAVITLSAVTPARTAVVSVALAPAVLTLAAVAPSVTPGASSRALTPSVVTLSAVAPAVVAGAVSVALTPAAMTLVAVAPAVAPGASSRALTPSVITITAVAPALAAAISRAITPAVITLTAVTPAMTAGAISVALAPNLITISAVTPSRTAVVSVALTPSMVAIVAVTPAVSAGAISVALTPATVTLSAVTPARTAAVTLALAPALLTLSAVTPALTPGAVSVASTPAVVTIVAVTPAVTPGAVSVAITPIVLTIIAVTPSAIGGQVVALTPNVITISAVTPSVTASAVSVALAPAVITISAVAPAVVAGGGPQTVALSPAVVTLSAVTPAVLPGAVSLALTPAVLTLSAVTTSVTTAVAVTPTPAIITILAVTPTVSAGGVSLILTPAAVTISAVTPSAAGALSRALSPGVVTMTAVAPSVVAGAVTLALTPATMTVTAVAPAVAIAQVVALTPALITISAIAPEALGGPTDILLLEASYTPMITGTASYVPLLVYNASYEPRVEMEVGR